MAGIVPIFKGAKGLNNALDASRLAIGEDGSCYLPAAYNVDIDDTGRVSRRKGGSLQLSGNIHSLYVEGDVCLMVKDGYLCLLASNYSYTNLVALGSDAKMSYATVDDRIYYANGVDKGYFWSGAVYTWELGTYVGPETTRVFGDIPNGTILEYYRGRIYIADGYTVWYSEPYATNLFDLTRNYVVFDTNVRMVVAVQDGVYISSGTGIFFLKGGDPQKDFTMDKVYDFPALEGTSMKLHAKYTVHQTGGKSIEVDSIYELSAMWSSQRGVCFGSPQGEVINITEYTVRLPPVTSGTSGLFRGKFVTILNP